MFLKDPHLIHAYTHSWHCGNCICACHLGNYTKGNYKDQLGLFQTILCITPWNIVASLGMWGLYLQANIAEHNDDIIVIKTMQPYLNYMTIFTIYSRC